MEKKARAEAKRARRKQLKESGGASDPPEVADLDGETAGDESESPERAN